MPPVQTSKVRLCTETLPTGVRCTQIALRGQPWCRAHSTANHRERNTDTRQIIAMISKMDAFAVANMLGQTIYDFRTRTIPPFHAQAIFDAATTRLEQLIESEARSSQLACQIGKQLQLKPTVTRWS